MREASLPALLLLINIIAVSFLLCWTESSLQTFSATAWTRKIFIVTTMQKLRFLGGFCVMCHRHSLVIWTEMSILFLKKLLESYFWGKKFLAIMNDSLIFQNPANGRKSLHWQWNNIFEQLLEWGWGFTKISLAPIRRHVSIDMPQGIEHVKVQYKVMPQGFKK